MLYKVRDVNITPEQLKAFEEKVKNTWLDKQIKAPIHLSGGSEKEIIEMFKYIHPEDRVYTTWRSHYAALCHGIDEVWLYNEILKGRSITIWNPEHHFYTSAIVGGILPIAVGSALALKKQNSDRKVFVIIGDMAYNSGIFYETLKYSIRNDLPIHFLVEDNGLSTNTPTQASWGLINQDKVGIHLDPTLSDKISYFTYERIWPHTGVGTWINF